MRWAVPVKMYGNNPKMLFIIIKINKEIKIKIELFKDLLFTIILNSLYKRFRILK
jgi:hypothetical protein